LASTRSDCARKVIVSAITKAGVVK